VQGFSPLWAVVVAFIPAALALWSARQLISFIDDPALAERLAASRARNGVTFGACFVATAALAPRHAVWTLPLLTVANATARYPAVHHAAIVLTNPNAPMIWMIHGVIETSSQRNRVRETSIPSVTQLEPGDGTFAGAVALAADRIAVASSRRNGAIVRFYNR